MKQPSKQNIPAADLVGVLALTMFTQAADVTPVEARAIAKEAHCLDTPECCPK